MSLVDPEMGTLNHGRWAHRHHLSSRNLSNVGKCSVLSLPEVPDASVECGRQLRSNELISNSAAASQSVSPAGHGHPPRTNSDVNLLPDDAKVGRFSPSVGRAGAGGRAFFR